MNHLTISKITITDADDVQCVNRPFSCVGVLDGSTMSFAPDQWAPGVFAGTEYTTVLIDDQKYVIKSLSLENRTIEVIKITWYDGPTNPPSQLGRYYDLPSDWSDPIIALLVLCAYLSITSWLLYKLLS